MPAGRRGNKGQGIVQVASFGHLAADPCLGSFPPGTAQMHQQHAEPQDGQTHGPRAGTTTPGMGKAFLLLQAFLASPVNCPGPAGSNSDARVHPGVAPGSLPGPSPPRLPPQLPDPLPVVQGSGEVCPSRPGFAGFPWKSLSTHRSLVAEIMSKYICGCLL